MRAQIWLVTWLPSALGSFDSPDDSFTLRPGSYRNKGRLRNGVQRKGARGKTVAEREEETGDNLEDCQDERRCPKVPDGFQNLF